MRLLQKVGGVLAGKRKAGPDEWGAQAPGPSAPPPVPPASEPPHPAPEAEAPPTESLPPTRPAPPRNGAPVPLPEFPDLDLMALLPPELRQSGSPTGRAAPREEPSAPAAPPVRSLAHWADEDASFAFAPMRPMPAPSGEADGPLRPDPAAQPPAQDRPADGPEAAPPVPQPAPTSALPVSGFAAFLAEGLRHLDAPEPGPASSRAAPPALPQPEPPAPPRPQPEPPAETAPMQGLSASLSLAPAREIAGLVAACLVDGESGLPLAAEGRGPDLDAVAAHGTEVVRASRAAIAGLGLSDDLEDMLVTTDRRLLVIRPLRRLPTAFLFLILDRRVANLGMARLQLDRIESGLGP